jgi:hypothetical protein
MAKPALSRMNPGSRTETPAAAPSWSSGLEVFSAGLPSVPVSSVIIAVAVEVAVMIEVLFLAMVVVLATGMGLVAAKTLVRRSVKKTRYLAKKLAILNVCNSVL